MGNKATYLRGTGRLQLQCCFCQSMTTADDIIDDHHHAIVNTDSWKRDGHLNITMTLFTGYSPVKITNLCYLLNPLLRFTVRAKQQRAYFLLYQEGP